jgi:hypothetical protein
MKRKMSTDQREPEKAPEKEEFAGLLKFTATGFLGGLLAGILLDSLGFQRNAMGQWIVRTLSGEGESILEGISGSAALPDPWPKLMDGVNSWA